MTEEISDDGSMIQVMNALCLTLADMAGDKSEHIVMLSSKGDKVLCASDMDPKEVITFMRAFIKCHEGGN